MAAIHHSIYYTSLQNGKMVKNHHDKSGASRIINQTWNPRWFSTEWFYFIDLKLWLDESFVDESQE